MVRFVFVIWILCAVFPTVYGQYTVYKDEKGQILTRVDSYAPGINSTGHSQVFYQGSPFLTFPVWQPATIRLDDGGQELDCELAYNLITNEVMCRFSGDPAVKIVTPNAFTINGVAYVRQQNKSVGIKHYSYFTALHNGPTKLVVNFSKQLKPSYTGGTGYDRELNAKGFYELFTRYYVQKGNAFPELINLSKNSLLKVLYEQAEPLAAKLPNKELTMDAVIETLVRYDTLMAATRANKPPLRYDPVFVERLRDKISYPNLASSQGIYGRVYVGFEITELGKVKDIVLLSPENIGFGFAETVGNALAKLPDVDPAFRGKYALPIAFTYTNAMEKTAPHVPINQLQADRLGGRVLLEEFTVPSAVNKPVVNSREVWGYYK